MMDWLAAHGSMCVLLVFFSLFLAFSFWAYAPRNKEKMNSFAQIPLRETTHVDE